jgi:hypothetical protein
MCASSQGESNEFSALRSIFGQWWLLVLRIDVTIFSRLAVVVVPVERPPARFIFANTVEDVLVNQPLSTVRVEKP